MIGNVLTNIKDSLVNFVAELGTERDKAASSHYGFHLLTYEELSAAYRCSWLPRKIVDIPAVDSARQWRLWRADAGQITALEDEEKRHNLKAKVIEARKKARLYGTAALYFDIGDADLAEPVDPARVRKGGLKFVTVIGGPTLRPGPLDMNPMSEYFNKPRYYTMINAAGQNLNVHPSRLAIFTGAERLDDLYMTTPYSSSIMTGQEFGFGDSALQSVYTTLLQADATSANIASLIFEAKVDVVTSEGLMDQMDGGKKEAALKRRYALAAQLKGNNGMLVLDGKETYNSKVMQFGSLPDIMDRFFQNASGAADIPMTRLYGQSPSGLAATGESDLRNYYDRLGSDQQLYMTPALLTLDEIVIQSALGARPASVYYEWAPLWELTSAEKAEIFSKKATAVRTLAGSTPGTEIIPLNALSEAAISMFVEDGIMPGLEEAIDEFGTLDEQEDDNATAPDAEPGALRLPANANEQQVETQTAVNDARPKPLYVSRSVVNADEIREHYSSQGLQVTVDNLHVTVIYSTQPLDWFAVGEAWDEELVLPMGGARDHELFGPPGLENSRVLMISSRTLHWRNREFIEAGASTSYDEYQPHITLQYGDFAGEGFPDSVEPYTGRIVLGPEIFEDLKDD